MSTTEHPAESLGRHLRPELFRSLCDPTRLVVLARLVQAPRPLQVTEVSGCCGVHLSGVSRHLAILRDAGVVEAVRDGREVRYALRREALTGDLRGLADAIDACRGLLTEEQLTGSACCPPEGGSSPDSESVAEDCCAPDTKEKKT